MHLITVILRPERDRTLLWARTGSTELLRAQLPVTPLTEPRALPTLLEGLSLAFEQRLSVVLVADERGETCCGATYAGLVETRPLFYDVGIAGSEVAGPLFGAEVEDEDDLGRDWGWGL